MIVHAALSWPVEVQGLQPLAGLFALLVFDEGGVSTASLGDELAVCP